MQQQLGLSNTDWNWRAEAKALVARRLEELAGRKVGSDERKAARDLRWTWMPAGHWRCEAVEHREDGAGHRAANPSQTIPAPSRTQRADQGRS